MAVTILYSVGVSGLTALLQLVYLDLECLPVAVGVGAWCDGLLILTAPLWCVCVCVCACVRMRACVHVSVLLSRQCRIEAEVFFHCNHHNAVSCNEAVMTMTTREEVPDAAASRRTPPVL